MEKTLKRQIGYKKPSVEKKPLATKKEVKTTTDVVITPKSGTSPSKRIVDWLKTHPLITMRRLSDEIGIDPSNFLKILKAQEPSFKPGIIEKIETALKDYGYTKN